MLVIFKYEYFSRLDKAQKCFEEKDAAGQHPTMYRDKPDSNTKKEYAGLKQNLLWQGAHPGRYFKTRPYVVVWFER